MIKRIFEELHVSTKNQDQKLYETKFKKEEIFGRFFTQGLEIIIIGGRLSIWSINVLWKKLVYFFKIDKVLYEY